MAAFEIQSAFGDPFWRILMALGMGALIGVERERRKGDGSSRAPAGLRTFALIGLLGGLAAHSQSTLLLVLAGVFTMCAALLGYGLSSRRDPGLTTEVALVATFLLGAEAQHNPAGALALTVIVTVLLAWRDSLHHFVRDILSEQELHNALIFAIAALVVLPLLPNRVVDPFGLFNPFLIWRVAVVMMGLSAAGHAAARVFGPRYGLLAAGFASGFVSSSATIAAMGGRARNDDASTDDAALGAVSSTLGSLAYLVSLVAAADLQLVAPLAAPIGCALIATALYAAMIARWRTRGTHHSSISGDAFNFKSIFVFVLFLGGFSFVASSAIARFGEAGIYLSSALTGAIDVHAASTSIAAVTAEGRADLSTARFAILLALTANMLVKIPLSFASGTRAFATRVSVGLLVLVAGLWLGEFLWTG